MPLELPPELAFLESDVNAEAREQGWSRFVDKYTRLMLRTAGEFGSDYDGRLDRYRHILDCLREDEFRRLRAFRPVSGSSVAAWLAVVARRICLDHERAKRGRIRGDSPTDQVIAQRRLRRLLATPGGGDFDPTDKLPTTALTPEEELREAELKRAVDRALRQLTPRQQLAIRLRFEDGLSVSDVGEVLGMRNVFQVYRMLRSALNEAKRYLEESGVRDADP